MLLYTATYKRAAAVATVSFAVFGETIEAMQHPRKYFKSYILGFFPLFFMIVSVIIML
jgi:hypothetical protein